MLVVIIQHKLRNNSNERREGEHIKDCVPPPKVQVDCVITQYRLTENIPSPLENFLLTNKIKHSR